MRFCPCWPDLISRGRLLDCARPPGRAVPARIITPGSGERAANRFERSDHTHCLNGSRRAASDPGRCVGVMMNHVSLRVTGKYPRPSIARPREDARAITGGRTIAIRPPGPPRCPSLGLFLSFRTITMTSHEVSRRAFIQTTAAARSARRGRLRQISTPRAPTTASSWR